MIEKSSTLYKIIILYMLEKVNFPLSNNQITNFFLDHGYTSYFHVQQTLNDLLESRLMEVKKQGKPEMHIYIPEIPRKQQKPDMKPVK